jgi:hypothetical protein
MLLCRSFTIGGVFLIAGEFLCALLQALGLQWRL